VSSLCRGPLRVPALLIAPLLSFVSAASAASLEGRTTLGHSAVSGALVRAQDIDGPNVFITQTDTNGRYLLKGLGAGAYLLEVEVEGQLAFRARIEVREPTTRRDIGLVTSESVPYVNLQIVSASDDAVVTLNGIQVLRWGVDGGETRKFALTQPRNILEVAVTLMASVASGIPIFGGRTPARWRYHVIIRTGDGDKWEYQDAQESAAVWPEKSRVPVLRGTLIVDGATRNVRLVEVDRDLWKKTPPSRRMPSIQF